ncbi:transposable element Tcb1 transposase [Trichonephila clavipes]|nr:transposable element Tcb1 transposase [Trichonephila clavipes]
MLRRLVGTTAPGHIMIVQFRNEKVSNHGSIPITIHCNVVAFIAFEEAVWNVSDESIRSEELGITQSFISRAWKRFQADDNVSRRYRTGRPLQVTTPNEDRYLAVTAKRNKQGTTSDLSRELSSANGRTVSSQTAYILVFKLVDLSNNPLTATNCRLWLAWSREQPSWTPQLWACMMFSDESRFSLLSDSLIKRQTMMRDKGLANISSISSHTPQQSTYTRLRGKRWHWKVNRVTFKQWLRD